VLTLADFCVNNLSRSILSSCCSPCVMCHDLMNPHQNFSTYCLSIWSYLALLQKPRPWQPSILRCQIFFNADECPFWAQTGQPSANEYVSWSPGGISSFFFRFVLNYNLFSRTTKNGIRFLIFYMHTKIYLLESIIQLCATVFFNFCKDIT
jgi:hypothetical protein